MKLLHASRKHCASMGSVQWSMTADVSCRWTTIFFFYFLHAFLKSCNVPHFHSLGSSSTFAFRPLQTGGINLGSHKFPAESQLSHFFAYSDGTGHTSGSLSSLLHLRHGLNDLSTFTGFYSSWNNKTFAEPKQYGDICLSSRSWTVVPHALAKGLF